MNKLLVLSFFPAFTPPLSGGELRLYNMYVCLSERFDISLISWTHSQSRLEIMQHRQTFREYRVPKDRAFNAAYESCHRAGITGELAGVTCSMVGRNGNTQYHQLVSKVAADVDAVVHEFPYTVPYDLGMGMDRKPRIYNSHNLESDMVASLAQGTRAQEVVDSVEDLERRLVGQSCLVFATSVEELLKFRSLYGVSQGKLRLAPNGFAPDDFDFIRDEAEGESAYALFIGSQHPPNVEGGRFLVETIAPRFPRQRFVVAGRVCQSISSPPPNVKLLGEVTCEEKQLLFRRAHFFVNPIFSGAGTSLKMVEAMAAGLPIITTHAGARGLGLRHEIEALLAERDDFEGAVSRLMHNGELRTQLARAARQNALAHFSWPTIGRSVADEIDQAIALPEVGNTPTRIQTLVVNDYSVRNAVSGGSKRIYNLLREVATDRDVTLLCLHDKPTVDVEELVPGLIEIRVPKRLEHRAFETDVNSRQWISINDIATALYCLDNVVLTRLFRRLCDNANVVICSHPYLAPLLELVGKQLPVIYEAHNVEAELKGDILKQHIDGDILSAFVAQLEDYLQQRADAIICTTDADRKAFKRRAPDAPSFVVMNGCELPPAALIRTAIAERSQRDLSSSFRAVFVGSGHPPNVDAVKFLCANVLPQLPDMELCIIGSVGAGLDDFAHLPGLRRFSVVSDEKKQELLLQADIALNPVVRGGGSNLKLADYCGYGLPTVSTPDGARGFDVSDGVHLLIRPQSRFVGAIQELIANPALRSTLAEAAYDFAGAHLDWRQLGQQYTEVLRTVTGTEPARRAPRMLVVTYRYTEPCLGGAEEYLVRTLQRYVALFGTSVDLVAPNVGDIGNQFRFASSFAISQTTPEQLFAPFLRKVELFPPNPLDQSLLQDMSERLRRMWMTERRLLGRRAAQTLFTTCLLGGWYDVEQHEGEYQRWSSECAEIHITQRVSGLRLTGWHDGPAVIDVCVDGQEPARIAVSGDVAFEIPLSPDVSHRIQLSIPPRSTGGSDARHLGLLLKCLEVLEGRQGVWRTVSLEHGFEALWQQSDPAAWIDALRSVAEKRTVADEALFRMVRGPRSSALVDHVRSVASQYDVVLVQGVPFSLSVDVAQTVRDAGVPLLILPHFHVDDAFYHWRQYYELFAGANAVLSFSEWVSANFFARLTASAPVIPGGGVEPAEYVPRAAHLQQFRRFRDTPRPYFLVLGRKTGSKGYRTIIQAHQQMLRAGDLDVDLVLIGPDDDQQPITAEKVFYYGRLCRELVLGALAGCTALISMSTSESFGIVLIEAWMSGRPVIANGRCLSFTELVDDGADGVLVGNLGELVDAMSMMMAQPKQAAMMGAAGQRKAMARYTWSAVAQRLHQIITEVCEGVGSGLDASNRAPLFDLGRTAVQPIGSAGRLEPQQKRSRKRPQNDLAVAPVSQ
jgi:glycosyltransferase involved in cell wall biosynthesis